MDIITYLLTIIQQQYKTICWLLNLLCRYIPLKQWVFDDSHSPKYQKFKIDELPKIQPYHQDWTYKELIPYWQKRYSRSVKPVSRHSGNDIPEHCSCPRCSAPFVYLYKNNGSKGQLLCKVCSARFSRSDTNRFSSLNQRVSPLRTLSGSEKRSQTFRDTQMRQPKLLLLSSITSKK